MVVYEDPDMGSAVFDDEAEAREHFEKASIAWNCYLFGLMPRTTIPVPRGGIETDWHTACVLLHRRFRKLEKAAQAVISETARIHDNEPWPIKYRAPYEAITKLIETLAEVGTAYPPSALSTHSEGKDEEGEWRPMKDAPTDRALLLDISYWYPDDLAPTECFVIGQAISGGRWDCEDGVRTIDQINGWRPIPKTSIRSTETPDGGDNG